MLRLFRPCIILVLVIELCISPSPARCEDVKQPTLEDVTHRLVKWKDSFVNLRVVYELQTLPPTKVAVTQWPPPDSASANLFFRGEWIWADHGLDLFDTYAHYWQPGKPGFRSAEVFNGPKEMVFKADYRKSSEGKDEFTNLTLYGTGAGKPVSNKTRTPVQGLYWSTTVSWLPKVLEQTKWTLDEVEEVNGTSCVRITIGNVEKADAKDVMWLDLEHDCLVKRLRHPRVPGRQSGLDFVVDEFQQMDNGSWFPKRGRLQLPDGAEAFENQLWVVTEAEMNQSLDLTRFEPPAPSVGTVVTDTRNGTSYRHGIANATPPTTQASSAQVMPPSTGTPPMSFWRRWSSVLICVSLALMLLILGFWLRHTRKG